MPDFPHPIEPAMCTPQLRLQILHGLPFFATLSHQDIHAIDPHFREHGHQPGETIFHTGERATHFYAVAAGHIKLLRHTLSGQDVLLDILTPGDYFGALPTGDDGEQTYPDTARAHTAACTLTIPTAHFAQILQQHPTAALRLLEITTTRLRHARETIHQLSAYNAEQRIAATLLKLARKLGQPRPAHDDLLIQIPLSRQDIADMTGATVETTSRILSNLRKQDIIRSGRQWIALHNLPALEALTQSS